jgi:hypothetical protein
MVLAILSAFRSGTAGIAPWSESQTLGARVVPTVPITRRAIGATWAGSELAVSHSGLIARYSDIQPGPLVHRLKSDE